MLKTVGALAMGGMRLIGHIAAGEWSDALGALTQMLGAETPFVKAIESLGRGEHAYVLGNISSAVGFDQAQGSGNGGGSGKREAKTLHTCLR